MKAFGVTLFVIFISLCLTLLGVFHQLRPDYEPALFDECPAGRDEIQEMITTNQTLNGPLNPPFRTQGRYIFDSTNARVKLVSVNWYGASDELFVPGGLDVKHRQAIATTIRKLGFNSVRLPYADEMVKKNPLVPAPLLAANDDLVGSRALDVFHAVVESLTRAGLAVIVNNHITQSRWCCDGNPCDAAWSNSFLGPFCPVRQTEQDWIDNWKTVMKPHTRNHLVVGADLRNEVRGVLGKKRMWKFWAQAAENAARELHQMQPAWLMIVEGVASANDLSEARARPVQLTVPNKLVYSAHVYGWSGWGALSPYWRRNYTSFAGDMRKNWAYLLEEEIAPVWVGEFGAPSNPNKGDLHYWKNLMKYLEQSDADLGYWAINPRKPKENEEETYSLVEDDWETIKYDYRLCDLARLAQTRRRQPSTRDTQSATPQNLDSL